LSDPTTADIPVVASATTLTPHEPAAGDPAPAPTTANNSDPRAWVLAELPPAYQEIAGKIAALRQQAQKYEEISGVLWQVGKPLALGIRDLFSVLQYEATLTEHPTGYNVRVNLGAERRLVMEVVGSPEAIDRQSPALTELLRILQTEVGDHDRLVLAINSWCELPLEARKKDLISAEALKLATRVRANVVPTSTLFGIWKHFLTDPDAARQTIMKLYTQDGGFFR
jgi:hypothetical protein